MRYSKEKHCMYMYPLFCFENAVFIFKKTTDQAILCNFAKELLNPAVAIIIIIIMIILHRWNMFTLIEKAREFLIELYIYIYISISGCLLLYSHFIYSIRSETVLKRSWGHLVASLSDFYETPNNVHWRVERDCIDHSAPAQFQNNHLRKKKSHVWELFIIIL